MTKNNHSTQSTQSGLAVPMRNGGRGLNFTRTVFALALWLTLAGVTAPLCLAQTAATGALGGAVTDPTGAVVPGVQIKVTSETTGETRTVTSRADGAYVVPLLPPGSYRVEAEGKGFKRGTRSGVRIEVTETATLEIRLEVGAASETVTVNADAAVVQTESSALGRVTGEKVVVSLPLVTRNYTQILALSPGVSSNVSNAATLGRGSDVIEGSFLGSGSGTYVHGARAYDNNFQMNGTTINDLQGSGGSSGGFAVPNPDTIQTFKVQTGLYDASFGRSAGANVNVVTKSGSNEFHGALFEFFRNEALNANDFFFNSAGRKKGILRQNQYGFALGGPIKKDKLLAFGSYQGNRQVNGIAAGGSAAFSSPPLTNDRSAAALGSLFAGQSGAGGGTAILANGSNINPVALRLFQMKLPDGNFRIPTPQTINPSLPFARRGFSVFSSPSAFNENQYMINLDFLHTAKSKFEGRFFSATSNQIRPLPGAVPGTPGLTHQEYRNLSVAHTYTISSNLFNEARFGFHRTINDSRRLNTFKFSDLGINAVPTLDDIPTFTITGSYVIGIGDDFQFVQNHYNLLDSLTYVRGPHTMRAGGGLTNSKVSNARSRSSGNLTFQSFPDLLLGLSAAQNGSAVSNVFTTFETLGMRERDQRVHDGFLYLQDDFKATPRLTLNLGLRYDRIGQFADAFGRNANFNIALANPNPPATGSLAGFIIPANSAVSSAPAGVTQLDSNLVINGERQNNISPRLGFAWQVLPNSNRFVLRGGYGDYYSRLTGQPIFQLISQPPFSLIRTITGTPNAGATLSNPFPAPVTFPSFVPYSPATNLTIRALAADYRPSVTRQYSLNLQTEIARDFLLEIGYVGTRGTHLQQTRSLNQAGLASASNPIRGVTTNTVANIAQRVPIQGFTAPGLTQIENSGGAWYNGLEASLTKRFSRGLQFQASYTFSKALDTNGLDLNSSGIGALLGNNNDPSGGYGRAIFDRTQRFVLSYVYEFPIASKRAGLAGKVLGGWAIGGVTTIQTGQALTITATNANSVFGITNNRAQLAANCTFAGLTTSGGVSQRVSNYFNRACFAAFPIIGDDGRATGYGNSGSGIVEGPGQNNTDIALFKKTPLRWPNESANLEFRAEFFNAFNHSQFANPGLVVTASNFGQITATSVSPRILQFALKLNF